jgi:hypothetical protein
MEALTSVSRKSDGIPIFLKKLRERQHEIVFRYQH